MQYNGNHESPDGPIVGIIMNNGKYHEYVLYSIMNIVKYHE